MQKKGLVSSRADLEKLFISTLPFSGERYGKLEILIDKEKPDNPDKIRKALTEVSHKGTIGTVILDPAHLTAWIAHGGKPNASY